MGDTIIFHHKDVSPYSEKIRLMFGYSKLRWQSIQVPLTPPRPSIDPLINGYRRIPVAQIGGDLFCDTRLIAEQIAQLSNHVELNPFDQPAAVERQQEHIETDIFVTGLAALPILGLIKALWQQIPLSQLGTYLADKKLLIANGNPDLAHAQPSRKQAKAVWIDHLDLLNQQLSKDFLTGNSPCYLDFCAYHMIWFRMGMDGIRMLRGLQNLIDWYERMHLFGHGDAREISPQQALMAANTEPREIPEDLKRSKHIGSQLTIGTKDILLGDTQGILVGEDSQRWIISKQTQSSGKIHVHLPKASCDIRVKGK